MNKKQRIKACKNLYVHIPHIILDGTKEKPRHIRIVDIGDIWPTTGTFKLVGDSEYYRGERGLKKLAKALRKISIEDQLLSSQGMLPKSDIDLIQTEQKFNDE